MQRRTALTLGYPRQGIRNRLPRRAIVIDMSEQYLLERWAVARRDIVLAQLGPIFLLTLTVAGLQFGLAEAPLVVKLATAGILLATGMLGAAAQIGAGTEGAAIAKDLAALPPLTATGRAVAALGPWTIIVRVGAPAIFVLIFITLLVGLFAPA